MELRLYKINADPRKLDKVSGIAVGDYYSTSGTLRYPTNITNPSIIISANAGEPNAQEILDGCNYAYIGGFDRYYFIENKSYPNQGLIELILREDVLQSFATDILKISAYVLRNETHYNANIQDDLIQYTNVKVVDEYIPANATGTSFTFTYFKWDDTLSYNKVCCAFNTSTGSIASTDHDELEDVGLPVVNNLSLGATPCKAYYAINDTSLNKLIRMANASSATIGSYIVSLMAFPFEVGTGSVVNTMPIGDGSESVDWKTAIGANDGTTGYLIHRCFYFGALNGFEKYRPYSMYELFIPFIGYIEVNPIDLNGKYVIIAYAVNYENGSANCLVYAVKTLTSTLANDSKPIYQASCQIGRQIGVTQSNLEMNNALRESNKISYAIGMIGSAVSIAAGVVTENPMLIASGAMGAVKSTASFATTEMQIKDKANVSFNGDVSMAFSPMVARVRITKFTMSDDTTEFYSVHRKQNGSPLYKAYPLLSSLSGSGMTILSNPVLDTIPCLDEEKKEIRDLLTTGVIL